MEAKEKSYNGMLMNGFLALVVNLVVIPLLAYLDIYYLAGNINWIAIPVFVIFSLDILHHDGGLLLARTEWSPCDGILW